MPIFWSGVIVIVVLIALPTYIGLKCWEAGVEHERQRCSMLGNEALQQRWSPSLRWVLNAISEGHDLLPIEQFVDPEGDKCADARRRERQACIDELLEYADVIELGPVIGGRRHGDKGSADFLRDAVELLEPEP